MCRAEELSPRREGEQGEGQWGEWRCTDVVWIENRVRIAGLGHRMQ